MTWRRAWAYVAVFVALACFHSFSNRQTLPQNEAEEVSPPDATPPIPFLAAKPEEVDEVEIEMSGQYAQIKRLGTAWQVVQPPGREVSADLVSALLTAVLEIPEVEVVGLRDDRTTEFGLDAPTVELRLRTASGTSLTIRLGTLNPARTAVYANGSGTRDVVLLGLNVRYYLDLVAEALFRAS
jgi:hypothetical protein